MLMSLLMEDSPYFQNLTLSNITMTSPPSCSYEDSPLADSAARLAADMEAPKTVAREVSEEEVEAEVSVEAREQEDTVAMPPPQELERREEQKLKSKFPGAPGGCQGVKDGERPSTARSHRPSDTVMSGPNRARNDQGQFYVYLSVIFYI